MGSVSPGKVTLARLVFNAEIAEPAEIVSL